MAQPTSSMPTILTIHNRTAIRCWSSGDEISQRVTLSAGRICTRRTCLHPLPISFCHHAYHKTRISSQAMSGRFKHTSVVEIQHGVLRGNIEVVIQSRRIVISTRRTWTSASRTQSDTLGQVGLNVQQWVIGIKLGWHKREIITRVGITVNRTSGYLVGHTIDGKGIVLRLVTWESGAVTSCLKGRGGHSCIGNNISPIDIRLPCRCVRLRAITIRFITCTALIESTIV